MSRILLLFVPIAPGHMSGRMLRFHPVEPILERLMGLRELLFACGTDRLRGVVSHSRIVACFISVANPFDRHSLSQDYRLYRVLEDWILKIANEGIETGVEY